MAARQAFSHEDLSEDSTTTSGSWPTTATFTFTPDASSDYWIFFSCLFANGSGTAAHYGEASVYHDQGATSVGYWATSFAGDQQPAGLVLRLLRAQEHVRRIARRAGLHRVDQLVARRRHDQDQGYPLPGDQGRRGRPVRRQDASASTTSTSYTTRTTLTFTPASTGDYLLISSAVLTADTASNAHGARLNHSGGSIYGENLTYPKATWLYNTWATAAKINLAASSNTFTLQYKTSANNAYIEQARILALRLDKFDNAYVAQDFTGGNSTSASDQDFSDADADAAGGEPCDPGGGGVPHRVDHRLRLSQRLQGRHQLHRDAARGRQHRRLRARRRGGEGDARRLLDDLEMAGPRRDRRHHRLRRRPADRRPATRGQRDDGHRDRQLRAAVQKAIAATASADAAVHEDHLTATARPTAPSRRR